ncbi:MAG: DNA polymerase III subunit alpha, partial [Flavobacterium psychrophilum]
MYLNCKTYFSLKYGTFSTEQLVKEGVEQNASAMALTNINSTADAWPFYTLCKENNIKPVLGAEIRNGDKLLYILLAANNKGFEWINSFISHYLRENKPFPVPESITSFFFNVSDGYIIYPLGAKTPDALQRNELIGVKPGEVNKIFSIPAAQRNKLVIRQPVTIQDDDRFYVHRLLRSMHHNVVESKLLLEAVCDPSERFLSQTEIIRAFKDHPAIITNTLKLLDDCNIDLPRDLS